MNMSDDWWTAVITAANIVLICVVVMLVGLGIWAAAGKVPMEIERLYPKKAVRMSHIPFAEQWRTSIRAEHLPLFIRARHRRFLLVAALIVSLEISTIYALVRSTANYWRCQMASLAPSRNRRQ